MLSGLIGAARLDAALVAVGVAEIDITPTKPVRLHGFPRGERAVAIAEVTARLRAKAMAIGTDDGQPVLLVTGDVMGFSDEMRTELLQRVRERSGLGYRLQLTLAAAHNHSAPALSTVAPFVFRQAPTAEQAAQIGAYGRWLMNQLEAVSLAALRDRQPASLAFVKGSVNAAVNRRLLKDGKWSGFGDNLAGPVDHELPLLSVRDPVGKLRAVWLSYACHGVCWRKPSVHSDWMGVTQKLVESANPGAIALVTIGCAGDQNPLGALDNDPDPTGRAVAAEALRLIVVAPRPLTRVPVVKEKRIDLPLEELPPPEAWATSTDWFGRAMHAKVQAGEPLPDRIPYLVQTWTFAGDLAVVFLAGEVFAEYGLRLKRELAAERLWVNAYANAMPAYIPTRAALPEGGYEIDDSRRSYGLPARLAPPVEEQIIAAVHELVPPAFDRVAGRKSTDNK